MRALIVGVLIGLIAGLLFQELRYRNFKKLNRQLQANVAELQKQVATNQSAAIPTQAAESIDQERTELLRLRNQAAQLRAATGELQQLRTQLARSGPSSQPAKQDSVSPAAAAELVPREAWSFAGYATPEAAFQSTMFAHSQGDHQAFLASLTGDLAKANEKELATKTAEQFSENLRRETAKFTGYRILEADHVSPEETVLMIYYAGESDAEKVMMRKVGSDWKLAGPPPTRSQP